MASLIPAEVFAQMMLRNSMPNSLGMQPQGDLAPQMGQFMQAHRMRLNNSPTPSQGQPVAGPMADSLMQNRRMRAAAGTDQRNTIDAQRMRELRMATMEENLEEKKRKEQAKQSVLNPQVQNPAPGAGTMTVTPGSGPNAITPEQMHEMSMRVRHGSMNSAVTNPNDLTHGYTGFSVSGLNPQAQPQPAANPIHDLIAQHVQQHPDSLVQQMSQIPGMTAQQIIAQINHERGAKVAKQDNRHAEFSQNKSVYDEERRQDAEDQKYIDNTGNDEKDPEVIRRKQAIAQRQPEENNLMLRMKGMVTPQQQGQGQSGQAIAHDPKTGQTYHVINGKWVAMQ